MTPWEWFAGDVDDAVYSLACSCATREEAIRQALVSLKWGERFQIVEARSSTAMEHDEADCVPFLRTRNHEVLIAGPHLVGPLQ